MNELKIIEYITEIIDSLSSGNENLESTIRKTYTLSYFLKNDKLKNWSKLELNGFEDVEKVPHYRQVAFDVRGNLELVANNNLIKRNNIRVPIELMEGYEQDNFEETYPLKNNIAELVNLSQGNVVVTLPRPMISPLQGLFENYRLQNAWIEIKQNAIIGVFSNIKNTLLELMLELNDEINNGKNLILMSKKGDLDKLINKTIGNFSVETINITNSNIIAGDNANMTINNSTNDNKLVEGLNELLEIFRKIEKDTLQDVDYEELEGEMIRLEKQSKKDNPRKIIITQSLNVVRDMLTNIASNAWTEPFLDKIKVIYGYL